MSAPRLPFLYPSLFRPLRASPPRPRLSHSSHNAPLSNAFSSSSQRKQGAASQRYGTAQEPAPHLKEAKNPQREAEKLDDKEKPQAPQPQGERSPPSAEESEADRSSSLTSSRLPKHDSTEAVPHSPAPEPPHVPESKPLDTVLHMPSPAEEENRKPPHLKTPPYVHHFDTYSLVKGLAKSSFTQDQAVTIMKAVRGVLTDNMELARAGLVSKSNVENETYLFRAACSELRTEVQNNRKGETEKMRTERNQLQHEVDILGQRLTQETGGLKDELKGLFDDRKMAVREEQRSMERKIQELNYQITVKLNSDARSEVEGLRWVLTRRAAMAIGISAFMLFLMLRYSSYVMHAQSEEKKKSKEKTAPPSDDSNPNSGNSNGLNKEDAVGGELLVSEGGVSLG